MVVQSSVLSGPKSLTMWDGLPISPASNRYQMGPLAFDAAAVKCTIVPRRVGKVVDEFKTTEIPLAGGAAASMDASSHNSRARRRIPLRTPDEVPGLAGRIA